MRFNQFVVDSFLLWILELISSILISSIPFFSNLQFFVDSKVLVIVYFLLILPESLSFSFIRHQSLSDNRDPFLSAILLIISLAFLSSPLSNKNLGDSGIKSENIEENRETLIAVIPIINQSLLIYFMYKAMKGKWIISITIIIKAMTICLLSGTNSVARRYAWIFLIIHIPRMNIPIYLTNKLWTNTIIIKSKRVIKLVMTKLLFLPNLEVYVKMIIPKRTPTKNKAPNRDE